MGKQRARLEPADARLCLQVASEFVKAMLATTYCKLNVINIAEWARIARNMGVPFDGLEEGEVEFAATRVGWTGGMVERKEAVIAGGKLLGYEFRDGNNFKLVMVSPFSALSTCIADFVKRQACSYPERYHSLTADENNDDQDNSSELEADSLAERPAPPPETSHEQQALRAEVFRELEISFCAAVSCGPLLTRRSDHS